MLVCWSRARRRADPRYLVVALLTVRWLMDPGEGVAFASRRMAAARERGRLGGACARAVARCRRTVLDGSAWSVRNCREAVDLLEALGYQSDPGVAYETLAGMRGSGLPTPRPRSCSAEPRTCCDGPASPMQPHLAHTVISCALSRGPRPGGDRGRGADPAERRIRLRCWSRSGWLRGWWRRTRDLAGTTTPAC